MSTTSSFSPERFDLPVKNTDEGVEKYSEESFLGNNHSLVQYRDSVGTNELTIDFPTVHSDKDKRTDEHSSAETAEEFVPVKIRWIQGKDFGFIDNFSYRGVRISIFIHQGSCTLSPGENINQIAEWFLDPRDIIQTQKGYGIARGKYVYSRKCKELNDEAVRDFNKTLEAKTKAEIAVDNQRTRIVQCFVDLIKSGNISNLIDQLNNSNRANKIYHNDLFYIELEGLLLLVKIDSPAMSRDELSYVDDKYIMRESWQFQILVTDKNATADLSIKPIKISIRKKTVIENLDIVTLERTWILENYDQNSQDVLVTVLINNRQQAMKVRLPCERTGNFVCEEDGKITEEVVLTDEKFRGTRCKQALFSYGRYTGNLPDPIKKSIPPNLIEEVFTKNLTDQEKADLDEFSKDKITAELANVRSLTEFINWFEIFIERSRKMNKLFGDFGYFNRILNDIIRPLKALILDKQLYFKIKSYTGEYVSRDEMGMRQSTSSELVVDDEIPYGPSKNGSLVLQIYNNQENQYNFEEWLDIFSYILELDRFNGRYSDSFDTRHTERHHLAKYTVFYYYFALITQIFEKPVNPVLNLILDKFLGLFKAELRSLLETELRWHTDNPTAKYSPGTIDYTDKLIINYKNLLNQLQK